VVGTKRIITSFEDLDVYKLLVELHLRVHELTMSFPAYEMYELGSQLRRSSNSIPANLAEGWNNRHSTVYIEAINRGLGELRETRHHLSIAARKGYAPKATFDDLLQGYDRCGRMLRALEQALRKSVASSPKARARK
jgi:four helix bundle protein